MSEVAYEKDTIAARATAPGRGGIGIVRISGPEVPRIAAAVTGRIPEPRYATFAPFRDGTGGTIDEGLVLYFPAPDSFTGEQVLELQGHGGPVVLDLLLDRIVSLGARIARPGEFSQRAFLNDKLDLTQAEAIADLINSSTQAAARGAIRSLQGEFSNRINGLLAMVIELRVYVEAAIDFPEEEIDFISDENVMGRLADVQKKLDGILDHSREGTLLTEGASIVLTGKPNAGKSSLMNRLTGRETAIVTDIPGTTRDVIGEALQLDGIPLRLLDTAGIRNSDDEIELEGVKRARAARAEADLILHLVDASKDQPPTASGSREVVVLNKVDLVDDRSALSSGYPWISAATGEGLDELKAHLKRLLGVKETGGGGFSARSRHLAAMRAAKSALQAGSRVLAERQAGELLAEELRECQRHLSEITGEFTADDLLGEIFSSFCVGK